MSYLSDYLYYNSGNECPEEYVLWAALSILGHVAGRKIWVEYGERGFKVHPNLLVCLVGDAASGKNSTLNLNIKTMFKHFPQWMLSASVQSREDIADQMASNGCIQTWKDTEGLYGDKLPGKIYEYRPFYILNNELENLLSVDKVKMIGFIIECFDSDHFSTGFKGARRENPDRQQFFEWPHLSMIAGTVPSWFMQCLSTDLFQKGLGRRLIIVTGKRTKVIPWPSAPEHSEAALNRVVAHLKRINHESCHGALQLSPDARRWWEEWYAKWKKNVPDDPILRQFHGSKNIQLLKIAGLLHIAEPTFTRVLDTPFLEAGLEAVNKLEKGVLELTAGIGKNDLAATATIISAYIDQSIEGRISRPKLEALYYRDCKVGLKGFEEVLKHLQTVGKIVVTGEAFNPRTQIIWRPESLEKYLKEQKAAGGS